MSAEQGDEWTPYHEFRKRTDPPPWGQGLDAEEPPMAEQGDVEVIRALVAIRAEDIEPTGWENRVQKIDAALDRLAAALALLRRSENAQAWRIADERAEAERQRANQTVAALERVERERQNADDRAKAATLFTEKWQARAEKAERALAEIVKFEGAVEGDESDQADALVEVSRIARTALRPEDTSDE